MTAACARCNPGVSHPCRWSADNREHDAVDRGVRSQRGVHRTPQERRSSVGTGANVSVRPQMILYAANREPRARANRSGPPSCGGFLGFCVGWVFRRAISSRCIGVVLWQKCGHLRDQMRSFARSALPELLELRASLRQAREFVDQERRRADRKPRRSARGGWPHGTRPGRPQPGRGSQPADASRFHATAEVLPLRSGSDRITSSMSRWIASAIRRRAGSQSRSRSKVFDEVFHAA